MSVRVRVLGLLMIAVIALVCVGCGSKFNCPPPSVTEAGSGGSGGISSSSNPCSSGTSGGGGGGGSTSNSAAFLYYLDGGGVEVASLTTTGTLATVTGVTPPAPAGAVIDDMIAVSNKFLYLPFADVSSLVQGFTIASTTGTLTSISGSPFSVQSGINAEGVVADPQGRFLFVGDETGLTGAISVYQIDSNTGALTAAPGSPFFSAGVLEIDSMAVDGTGKFLYAAQGSNSSPVLAFSIDQNSGALTPVAGSPFSLGVAQIHADPSGNFLMGVADTPDAFGVVDDPHIWVFSIDPTTGAPAEVAGSPFATVAAPFDFIITPNDKFVYTIGIDSSGSLGAIEGYSLDSSSGALTAVSGSPFANLFGAYCKIDPTGTYIFCDVDDAGDGFTVFYPDPSSGALSQGPSLTVSNTAFAWAVAD